MKTKHYLCIIFSLLIGLFLQTASAQANTELSNLVSPTKVNQSLLPITDNSKSLGSASIAWGTIYLAGSVYLDGRRFLTNGYDSTDVFVGTDAGNKRSTHTGMYNTASGYKALYSYTNGNYNTATGAEALYANTTGYGNTATGYKVLRNNTIGYYNTSNGSHALYYNTAGDYNTATGYSALFNNTSGNDNTANGEVALSANTTGDYNTAIGGGAGSYNDNNTFCTFIGYEADQDVSTDFTNSTALGYLSRITASNQVRIGSSNVTSIGGYEPWTNLSDGRFKKNVKENVPGLAFINQLHAVTYTMDVTKLKKFLSEERQNETTAPEVKTVLGKNHEAEALIQKGIQEKEKIIRTGFVAQEVEAAAKRIGYDFSGVDKPKNEYTPYGLRYSEFVVPLVKAVQELSGENEKLKSQHQEQQKINQDLQIQINELIVMISAQQSTTIQRSISGISAGSLEQNIPNPFNQTAIINYKLPQKYSTAKIIITDKNGKTLKALNVSNGKGSINVDAAMLSSGAYQYSLIIDGKLMDTKQMILTK